MSDGHGSTPDTPPGWSPQQPPPYGDVPGSPWTAPGSDPTPPPPPPAQPYGGAPPYPHPAQGPHGLPSGPPGPPSPPGSPGSPGPPGSFGPPGPMGPHGGQPYGYRPPPALRPGIIPLRPLGLGDILDGAIKLIRSNPRSVLGLSVIAAALAAIPVAVGQAVMLGEMGGVLNGDTGLPPGEMPQQGFLQQYGGSLISYAVQFVAVTLLSGVLTRILGRAVFGGKMTVGEAWRLTRTRVPTLFGLVAVTVVLLAVPMIAVILLIYSLITSGADPGLLLAAGAVGVLAFTAYALFVTTRVALAAPVAVLERRGVGASLRRSWHLVTGGFWRTLGILLLTQIIAGLVGMMASIPFTIVGSVAAVLGGGNTGAQILAAVLIAIGGTIAAMLTYPFQAGVNGLLYADRRMRSEAFDLVLQTAAIEQQRQGWVHASADDLWDPSVTPGAPGRGAPWSSS